MSAAKTIFRTPDISTQKKRRHAVNLIITELKHIRDAEDEFIEQIRLIMQDGKAHTASNYKFIDALEDAIVILMGVFNEKHSLHEKDMLY